MAKMICVCEHCGHHENDAGVEFNFREKKVYWMCPSCKKMNKLSLDASPSPTLSPLPKSTTLGRRRR